MQPAAPPTSTEPRRPSDEDRLLAPVDPRRPSGLRISVAVVVTLFLLVFSVAYHDGVFWTEPLSAIDEPGPYRVKGVIAHYDPATESFLLQDGDQQSTLRWNITQPDVGRVYVVDLELLPDGTLEALALTPVFLFK